MQLKITIERVLYANEENHWHLLRALMGDQDQGYTSVICKGEIFWTPRPDETLEITGEWVVYKGERQFKFHSAKISLPVDSRAQLHYICQRATGFGPVMEEKIWNEYGCEWSRLQAGVIKGLTQEKVEIFAEAYKNFSFDQNRAEVIAWLEARGCSTAMATAAEATWGEHTPGIVTDDCYKLATLKNFDFTFVDRNVRPFFDIADDDPKRIRSAISYAERLVNTDGSTVIDCNQHFNACRHLLQNVPDQLIISNVQEMLDDGFFFLFKGKNRICSATNYHHEKQIDEFISTAIHLGEDTSTPVLDENMLMSVSEFTPDASQMEAVHFAITQRFAVINGGAGVGKTSVIKMIAHGLEFCFDVILCAPTGKAAARLKEATGREASTIHAMLGANEKGGFSRSSLEHCAVIIDEASMVDSALMAEIVIRHPSRLILVGDQAQLPPVGAGQPFHDIIQLYPKAVRTLQKCYRATEAIFHVSSIIRSGNYPPQEEESKEEKWKIIPIAAPSDAEKHIVSLAEEDMIDFYTDIILCPKNGATLEDGSIQPATVNSLNRQLLDLDRRKRSPEISDEELMEKFIPGDRVINTKNFPQDKVWNGTTGTISQIFDDGTLMVQLDIPFRDEYDHKIEFVRFTKDMVKELEYAYALTIHKSQGSQYRNVYLLALQRDNFMLDRALVYTGITRAKKGCYVIGESATLRNCIQRERNKGTVLQCLHA